MRTKAEMDKIIQEATADELNFQPFWIEYDQACKEAKAHPVVAEAPTDGPAAVGAQVQKKTCSRARDRVPLDEDLRPIRHVDVHFV